jgi:predicted nucleic acid-binding protein
MSGFLLDTNTVSELVSVKPNQRVSDWLEASDEESALPQRDDSR